jgi:hypothetical protein
MANIKSDSILYNIRRKNKMKTKTTSLESPSGTLNVVDWKKIAKGAGIAFGGAFLFSLITFASAQLGSPEFQWVVFWNNFKLAGIPAACSVGLNAILKWWQGQPKE